MAEPINNEGEVLEKWISDKKENMMRLKLPDPFKIYKYLSEIDIPTFDALVTIDRLSEKQLIENENLNFRDGSQKVLDYLSEIKPEFLSVKITHPIFTTLKNFSLQFVKF